MAIQWLKLHLPMQGVAGLISGLGATIPRLMTKKAKQKRSNTVTKSIKTFKMVYIKNLIKKTNLNS